MTQTSSDLAAVLERHVRQGSVPGALAARGHADGSLEVAAAGDLHRDAIVRIQSMTKPVLAVATLRLVEAGRLRLEDPVATWLPELADPQVLRTPTSPLDDTGPADGPITVHHLLTNTSGYGMVLEDSPLQEAMVAAGVEAGPLPPALAADDFVSALAGLPLAFQPGQGWRYHHSFMLLGVLLRRLVGRPLGEHLSEDLLGPLGMVDTAYTVPVEQAHRLPAAWTREGERLVELEAAGGGPHVHPAQEDLSHHELVSTLDDYAAFARMLAAGGEHDGRRVVSAEHLQALRTDQVPEAAKTPESFFPGFWDTSGWGYGVAVEVRGEHVGRYGWSGGLGTDVHVDPDGSFGIVLTQVEMGAPTFALLEEITSL